LVNAISMELLTSLVELPKDRLQALSLAEDDSILESVVDTPPATKEGLRAFIASLVNTFLDGAEREPELFRFVMQEDGFRTLGAELDPGLPPGSQLGYTVGRMIRGVLEARGGDVSVADPLGQIIASGVEGTVRWWTSSQGVNRETMASLLTEFLWAGIEKNLD
jgi:hypothetical protein